MAAINNNKENTQPNLKIKALNLRWKHNFLLKMSETQSSYGLLHFNPRSILNMISTAAIERSHQKDIHVDVVQQMNGYPVHDGASQ